MLSYCHHIAGIDVYTNLAPKYVKLGTNCALSVRPDAGRTQGPTPRLGVRPLLGEHVFGGVAEA